MNIFISYRRDDSSGYAGRLYDRLAAHFGRPSVFMDIEALEPGVDFVNGIDQAMASCGALVVLIGTGWLSATDAQGRRRLDNPNDFIRLEVANALRRDLCVLPVLVNGASMPVEEELPPELAPLARRQAQELSNSRWDYDVGRLIEALERWLARAQGQTVGDPAEMRQALREPGSAPAGGRAQSRATRDGKTPLWVWPATLLALGALGWGLTLWLKGASPEPPTESVVVRPVTPPLERSVPAPTPTAAEPIVPPEPSVVEPSSAQPVSPPVAAEPSPAQLTPPEPSTAGPPLPRPSVSEPTPAASPETPPTAAAPAERIRELLEQAAADLAANRLTRPEGANAFLRYQEVLELAPEHPAALEGLRGLGWRYLELAARAFERGQRDQAHAYLDQAARFIPGEPELAALRERVASPAPPAGPDERHVQRCLEACEVALGACRAEAEAAAPTEDCMAQRQEHCEAERRRCSNDSQRLFVWGAISTEAACNGEFQQCIGRSDAECGEISRAAIAACEARAEECRGGCEG